MSESLSRGEARKHTKTKKKKNSKDEQEEEEEQKVTLNVFFSLEAGQSSLSSSDF